MAYEYTTATLVKNELRATSSFSSSTYPSLTTVTEWIYEISDYINQIAGRTYGVTSYSETFDYNGTDVLVLKNAPVISVTSVLYSTGVLGTTSYGLTDTKVENTDYTVYKDSGEIEFLSNWKPTEGLKKIQVNYTAGYATTPYTVQMLATKLVAKRVLDSLMQKDVNEKQSGKSVSVGSISIVKPADFGVKQYTTISIDIDGLTQKIIEGTSFYRLPLGRF